MLGSMKRFFCRQRRNALRLQCAGILVAGLAMGLSPSLAAADEDAVKRGAYLVRAGGCVSCHTAKDGETFAGGRPIKTPFGTFYSPNITPHSETGIGGWSDNDFAQAMREGVRPDGAHYFPAFPYTSYTRMNRADALAIKAYLFSLPPAARANRDHDVGFPFSWRLVQAGWKLLFFDAGELVPNPAKSEEWNRGAYLVEALAHCGECHTPRNAFGALDRAMWLAGTIDGPDGEFVPNITPDKETGIGEWSEGDIVQLFKIGFKPNFNDVQGSMGEAVEDGLKHLTNADLKAIAVYLLALPPTHNPIHPKQDN